MANSVSSVMCERCQCYGLSLLSKAVCMFVCNSFKICGYYTVFQKNLHHQTNGGNFVKS